MEVASMLRDAHTMKDVKMDYLTCLSILRSKLEVYEERIRAAAKGIGSRQLHAINRSDQNRIAAAASQREQRSSSEQHGQEQERGEDADSNTSTDKTRIICAPRITPHPNWTIRIL